MSQLTTLTRRQAEILRIVFAAKRPNVRAIADKLGSPNRLSGDLVELIQKRYLHMEREGKEHIYTITKPGLRRLVEHEGETAGSSILSLSEISKAHPQVQGLQDRIAELETAVKALEVLSGYRIAKPVGAELK